MIKRLINDRRGIALAYPFLFLILISCSALVLDIGRAHMVQSKMQLIDDSSALAGAMTADVERTVEYQTETKDGVIVIKEIPGETKIKINPEEAHKAARKAEQANGGVSDFWSKVMGKYVVHKNGQYLDSNETGWAGQVSGETEYYTETRTRLAPGLLKFIGNDGIEVYTNGTAEAYIDQPIE
ncbi:hypothetical protein ACOBQJ_03240 [Pelotomaculum propionicicum]|uniref:hypothetical protein n=1 Tax=Pelotomaculum propionicicum TaxID=258475 RepID=UPI003B7FD025